MPSCAFKKCYNNPRNKKGRDISFHRDKMAQVVVEQGTVQGKAAETYEGRKYYSFEGIPYAKPPVGQLRFRDPLPPERWQGVRDATKPGQKCAQMNPLNPTNWTGSEDCLYLNVYTPKLPKDSTSKLPKDSTSKLPVIFYVHGGRYILGYGDYYRPDYFLKHDVVFVTINYRVNILGFLSLGTKEVPGNAGLKDSVFALRWVKDNIERFNGDSSNITVFGESSGGGTVTAFLTSDMTKGLFSKLISLSACSFSDLFMVDEDKIEKAKFITTFLGKECSNVEEMYEVLKTAPVEDLLSGVVAAEFSNDDTNAFFLPVVEKKFDGVEQFFFESPRKSVLENRVRDVPILIGYCSHEGAFFMQQDDDGNPIMRTDLEAYIPRYLKIKKGSEKSKKYAEKLSQFYFDGKEVDSSKKTQYVDYVTDALFVRDIVFFIQNVAKHNKGNKSYVYKFDYQGSMSMRTMKNLGIKGATHGDILPYVFYRESKAKDSSEEDRKIVNFLIDAFYSFCKTGKPTQPNQKLQWPAFTIDKQITMNIDNELKLVEYPLRERMEFWKAIDSEAQMNSKL